jgi:hypothetical protein
MGNARTLEEENVRVWNAHDEPSWVNHFRPDATFRAPGTTAALLVDL